MKESEISEVWQALCVLSNAQAALTPGEGSSNKAVASQQINHAKAHLGRILEWAKESDHCVFIMAIRPARCTIDADRAHLAEPEGAYDKAGGRVII